MCLFSCACVNPDLVSHPDLDFGVSGEFVGIRRGEDVSWATYNLFFGVV